jgi:hypothetical protein
MAEVTKADWHKAFAKVENSLVEDGYTCDDLCPPNSKLKDGSPKRCIACETSLRLREILLGDEA